MNYLDLMKLRQEAIDAAIRSAHEKLTFVPKHWGSLLAGCECEHCKAMRAALTQEPSP